MAIYREKPAVQKKMYVCIYAFVYGDIYTDIQIEIKAVDPTFYLTQPLAPGKVATKIPMLKSLL